MTKRLSRICNSIIAIAALMISSSPALAGENKTNEMVPVGKPISCITPSFIDHSNVVDNQTIDFTMLNGDVYRNKLPYKCPGLKSEDRYAYKLSTNNLCSVDIITVLQNFGNTLGMGASCGLGTFQKMEKARH